MTTFPYANRVPSHVKTVWDYQKWMEAQMAQTDPVLGQHSQIHGTDNDEMAGDAPLCFSAETSTLVAASSWFEAFMMAVAAGDRDTQNWLLEDLDIPNRGRPGGQHPCLDWGRWQGFCLIGIDEDAYAYFHMYAGTGQLPGINWIKMATEKTPYSPAYVFGEELRPKISVSGTSDNAKVLVNLVDAYDLAVRFEVDACTYKDGGMLDQLITLVKELLRHYPETLLELPEREYMRWCKRFHRDSRPILEVVTDSLLSCPSDCYDPIDFWCAFCSRQANVPNECLSQKYE